MSKQPETEPDPFAAALAVQTAIDQLTQPGTVDIDRDIPIPGTDAYQLAADDRALEEKLWADLGAAAAAEHRDHAQAALRGLHQLDRRRTARTTGGATLPSLLEQLQDAVPNGTDRAGSSPGAGAVRSPLELAALDLLTEIARAVRYRGAVASPTLRDQLLTWTHAVTIDETQVLRAAELASTWPDRGRAILDPPKRWTLPGACPECGARTAYVEENGEKVRRPAIELDRESLRARCLRCPRGRWEGETQLGQLAKVLDAARKA